MNISWVFPIIIMALFNAGSLVALKLSSNRIDLLFLGLIVTGSAFISILIAWSLKHFISGSDILIDSTAIKWGVIAGVLSALVEILFLLALYLHAPLSVSVTVMRALSLVFAVALGIVIFHESITMTNWIGIALSLIGIVLLLR